MLDLLQKQISEILEDDEEWTELLNSDFSSVFSCKWNGAQHDKGKEAAV